MAYSTILIVGFRPGAVQAALNLGYQVIVWHEKALPKRYQLLNLQAIIAAYPKANKPVATAITQQLATTKLTAVIATCEKTVSVAARLRQQLNIGGTRLEVANRCHDKLVMKQAAQQAGANLTPYCCLNSVPVAKLADKLGLPLIIKQRRSSGSRGLQFIYQPEALNAITTANCLAEKLIIGKEYSIESFVQNGEILFRNITEYYIPHQISIMPAELPKATTMQIDALNRTVINHFQIQQGMCHLELYLTAEGIVFGEIALRPPGGYLMDLLQLSYGFDAWQAFLQMELGLPFDFPKQATAVSAGYIIHPGEGRVQQISGIEQIKQLASVKEFKLKVKAGSLVSARQGTGEECGHILLAATAREQLIASIQTVQEKLKIVINI